MKTLVKELRLLRAWLMAHPVIALVSTNSACFFAGLAASDESLVWPCSVIIMCISLITGLMIFVGMRRMTRFLIILAVCLSLAVNVKAPEVDTVDNAGGCLAIVAGVLVICGGAFCAYKLNKFCQKKFGTTKPPAETNNIAYATLDGSDWAASWNISEMGSCGEPPPPCFGSFDDNWVEDTSIAIDVTVGSTNGQSFVPTSMTGTYGPSGLTNWTGIKAEAASHGVVLTGRGDGSQYFSRDNIPILPNESIIVFDQAMGGPRIITGAPSEMVIVHRSPSLNGPWGVFLVTEIPIGYTIRIYDASRIGQMFYKIGLD
jgi:hypothetical protein